MLKKPTEQVLETGQTSVPGEPRYDDEFEILNVVKTDKAPKALVGKSLETFKRGRYMEVTKKR